ncbi:HAD family hydrolase [Motilimonas sp. 1_MG-2023]|uniref:HAD family hydrolase n=1 Tax=Motilimonas TaxID=1914248 RepID=UPI0026E44473|nr:HAD family hydrolase [Motilimonas sp. 1_MG-2023]MDO6527793.1 HAD family hydrolase [Motilimonas sp. 1_MG-2023]
MYSKLKAGLLVAGLVVAGLAQATDALPSWNEGDTKKSIIEFVTKTSDAASSSYIPESERIAVFDNDGTLWAEKPVYFQLYFALDQLKLMAPEHPEWKTKQPYADLLAGKIPKDLTEKDLVELVMTTHANMSSAEFRNKVQDWAATAKHPKTNQLFTDMVYQPMLELLTYLREHGYSTYIVSGGGVDFMRAWAPSVYGIPDEQIIGSRIELEYKVIDGKPQILRAPKLFFNNDKGGKPVGIQQVIGKQPIMAFGNSDGDQAMIQWTTSGTGPRFGLLVHHTDAKREWAYDKDSKVGHLDSALTMAHEQGWTIADMKNDWLTIFKWEATGQAAKE